MIRILIIIIAYRQRNSGMWAIYVATEIALLFPLGTPYTLLIASIFLDVCANSAQPSTFINWNEKRTTNKTIWALERISKTIHYNVYPVLKTFDGLKAQDGSFG